MKSKKILIVGKNSYIGKNLRSYLAVNRPDWDVEMIGAREEAWKQKKNYGGYYAVLIAAALVHQKENPEKEEMYREINGKMPVEIAKRAKQDGVPLVIFLSSMAVFGTVCERITKRTDLHPETMYARYKRQAELELEKMESETFQIAIIRPPMVYGKGCPGNYGKLEKVATHMPFFPDTRNRRSMISIENLCEALTRILEEGRGGYYHPQDPEYMNTADMVRDMRRERGKRTYTIRCMNWLLIPLSKRVGVFRKVFGSLWYDREQI